MHAWPGCCAGAATEACARRARARPLSVSATGLRMDAAQGAGPRRPRGRSGSATRRAWARRTPRCQRVVGRSGPRAQAREGQNRRRDGTANGHKGFPRFPWRREAGPTRAQGRPGRHGRAGQGAGAHACGPLAACWWPRRCCSCSSSLPSTARLRSCCWLLSFSCQARRFSCAAFQPSSLRVLSSSSTCARPRRPAPPQRPRPPGPTRAPRAAA